MNQTRPIGPALRMPIIFRLHIATAAAFIFFSANSFSQFAWHEMNSVIRIEFANDDFYLHTGQGISVSPDGVQIHDLFGGSSLAYGNGTYVAVSSSSLGSTAFAVFTNGFTWTNATVGISSLSRLAFGNGRFVATGTLGALTSSGDGRKWMVHSIVTNCLNDLIFADGRFVAVGDASTLVSEDGTNWDIATSTTNYSLSTITWGNGKYITGGTNVILSSPDGFEWTVQKEATNLSIQSICLGRPYLSRGRSK